MSRLEKLSLVFEVNLVLEIIDISCHLLTD